MKEVKIKIEALTQIKKSKKGKPFISVKDDANIWYSVWEKDLFQVFRKGETYNVLVEENGGFLNIRDVVSDELGVVPSGIKQGGEDKLDKIYVLLLELQNEVASLDVPRNK